MKRIENYNREKDSVESTREVPNSEYNGFHSRMENTKQKAISQFKNSYRSSLEVWLKQRT